MQQDQPPNKIKHIEKLFNPDYYENYYNISGPI